MTFLDLGPYLIGAGAVALIAGFSARRYAGGVVVMYLGVLALLGTMLKMIVDAMA